MQPLHSDYKGKMAATETKFYGTGHREQAIK